MANQFAKFTFIAAAVAFLPTVGMAADLKAEITTAGQHAGMAAAASDMATVQMHLHHTVNCIVGPNGAGYDPKQMNPCQNQGAGALPDATSAATKTSLQTAVTQAQAGLATTDIATAQKDAAAAAATLKSTT
ncbi:MAG: hypothetical protein ABSA49_11625 [Rhizomicrobium sp.]|jgi:hypothetical protein